MNYIEIQIRRALESQALWEDRYHIPEEVLTSLAKAVATDLGLGEFECDGERWWSTKFYPIEVGQ